MKSRKGLSGFAVIIALVIAVLAILSLVIYFYPKIMDIAQVGQDSLPRIEETSADLVVMNDSSNFKCNDFVNIINLYDEDFKDISIKITDNTGTRTIITNLPARSAVPLKIANGNINVSVDSTNKVIEINETNNNLLQSCP